jgi:hypothetical protein
MPFKEIYAVSFENGNLHPHLNVNDWDDMQRSPATPDNQAEWLPHWAGTTFRITRGPVVADDTPDAKNSVFVVPPAGSLSIESRVLLRATFDSPLAEGFDTNGNLHPIPSFGSGPDHGPLGGEFEEPGKSVVIPGDPNSAPALPASQLSITEPWAVTLNVGVDGDFIPDTTVHLTCQFNRRAPSGVRVNTPSALENNLPTEQADYLESPLNYSSYQGGLIAPGDDRWIQPPVFSLAHSFCGVGANANDIRHTSGTGFLKLTRISPPELRDHRVYTSSSLIHDGTSEIRSIGALGISVVTGSGVGRLSARLRSFSVSINNPLS